MGQLSYQICLDLARVCSITSMDTNLYLLSALLEEGITALYKSIALTDENGAKFRTSLVLPDIEFLQAYVWTHCKFVQPN
jgi:hypothetical protein